MFDGHDGKLLQEFWAKEGPISPTVRKVSMSYIPKESDSSDRKPQFFFISLNSLPENCGKFLKKHVKVALSFPNTAHCHYSTILNQSKIIKNMLA